MAENNQPIDIPCAIWHNELTHGHLAAAASEFRIRAAAGETPKAILDAFDDLGHENLVKAVVEGLHPEYKAIMACTS